MLNFVLCTEKKTVNISIKSTRDAKMIENLIKIKIVFGEREKIRIKPKYKAELKIYPF